MIYLLIQQLMLVNEYLLSWKKNLPFGDQYVAFVFEEIGFSYEYFSQSFFNL
jgi:hypothetical protein